MLHSVASDTGEMLYASALYNIPTASTGATMLPAVATGLLGLGSKLIDIWFPNAEENSKRKAELAMLQQSGELRALELSLSTIIAEAQSADPWTSRARPSFMYVIYTLILSSIPMGILYSASPDTAQSITTGFQEWLNAIPEELYTLFGIGYLGYTGAREFGKHSANKHSG